MGSRQQKLGVSSCLIFSEHSLCRHRCKHFTGDDSCNPSHIGLFKVIILLVFFSKETEALRKSSYLPKSHTVTKPVSQDWNPGSVTSQTPHCLMEI